VAEAGVVGAGEKRGERGGQARWRKFEVALAVLGGGKLLHGASGGAYRRPAHAVFIGDDDTGVDGFRVLEDLDQEIGLRFGIVRIE